MIREIDFHLKKLDSMKKYPKNLYSIGNLDLLDKRLISIVGTRKPTAYTKQYTHELSKELSKHNICIVSGAAMGVDAIAHNGAGSSNTIAVVSFPMINLTLQELI
jgi:DNA processing protein